MRATEEHSQRLPVIPKGMELERAEKRDYLEEAEMKKIRINREGAQRNGPKNISGGLVLEKSVSVESEKRINDYVDKHKTWRSSYPVLARKEYWELRAEYYPYIEKSDSYDEFFLRGVTMHPRLSEFPMCKDIIQDYFRCQDTTPIGAKLMNFCAPIKEQMSACINLAFLRNHTRGDKRFNEKRKDFFVDITERHKDRMDDSSNESVSKRKKFLD